MTDQENRPTIAISMGDPAGIGPEIILKALQDDALAAKADWIIVGNRSVWIRPGKFAEFQRGPSE